ALHEHHIGLGAREYVAHAEEDVARDIEEVLAGLHDVEFLMHRQLEELHHLIEDLAVLSGGTHEGLDHAAALELVVHGGHFDGLGPRAHNQHHAFHEIQRPFTRLPIRGRFPRFAAAEY